MLFLTETEKQIRSAVQMEEMRFLLRFSLHVRLKNLVILESAALFNRKEPLENVRALYKDISYLVFRSAVSGVSYWKPVSQNVGTIKPTRKMTLSL